MVSLKRYSNGFEFEGLLSKVLKSLVVELLGVKEVAGNAMISQRK